MTDYTDEAFNEPDMLLAALIADVEADKGRDRVEYDNMNEAYHADRWKAEGYTKRQFEDRMQRMTGRILGAEHALSVMYRAQSVREGVED